MAGAVLRRPARLPRLPVAPDGDVRHRLHVHWAFSNYWDAISDVQRAVHPLVRLRRASRRSSRCSSRTRSCTGSRSAAGRWKNLFLILIVAPFFVTYLVRTLAWLNILADQGPVVGILRDIHVLGARRPAARDVRRGRRGHHLQLPALHGAAALRVAGADRPAPARGGRGSLREQASGVPARDAAALRCPGIVAGTLLTFIPAAGDFINAQLLGTPQPVHGRQRDPVEVPRRCSTIRPRRRCRSS